MSYIDLENQNKPSTPSIGRSRWYISSVDGEPKYLDDQGVERSFIGQQGPPGQDGQDGGIGPQGPVGLQGPAGPAGGMAVEGVIIKDFNVTLPDSTAKQVIFGDNFTMSAPGQVYLMVTMAYKPHSSGNDVEFGLRLNGVDINPAQIEEHKDSSNDQSPWRTACIPVGSLPSGSNNLQLRFSKESSGGSAVLRYYSVIVVRYA